MRASKFLARSALVACVLMLSTGPVIEAQEPTGTVRGRVLTANTMRPLPGVAVAIPGTGRGTVTNAEGQYLLVGVPVGRHVIRTNVLGYSRHEVEITVVAEQTITVDLELREQAIGLDEIIVTGTAGGTERRAVGNVVTQIRAAEAVESALVPNLQGLLNARASNVVVMPGTGMVGTGSKIRIRGASSLSLSNDPLIYIDGVRVDNAQATGPAIQAFGSSVISRWNDFNPDDIESIEVIKGPAAATLYGTQAAKGVVHIITKRGRVGTPQFNFTMRQGASWFQNAEGRMFVNYWRNPNTGTVESLNLVRSEKEQGIDLFKTGRLQNYSLNVMGGSEGVRYYLGGDLDNEQGIEPTNRMRRMSGTANITLYPHSRVDIQTRLGYVGGRTYLSCEAGCGGVTWGSYFSTPAHLAENLPANSPPRRGYRSFTREAYYESTDFQDIGRFTGSVQLDYRPLSWLTNRFVLGTDEVREDNQSFTPRSDIVRLFSPTAVGGKTVSRRDVSYNTIDYAATGDFMLSPSLRSQTSFGAQYYRRYSKFVSATGTDFALPGLTGINATAIRNSGETSIEDVNVGVYLQQQLGWNDRVYVTGAVRADDASAFGENFDLVYYPKIHGTWVMSEEPFFSVGSISTLRLRAAYGQSGEQPAAFAALRTFNAVPGPGDISTITPGSPGNPDLGPERSSEVEAGFDAGLFNERVGIEFTAYRGTTRDVILITEAPPSEGFPGDRFTNLGRVDKWGYELMLRGNVFETRRAGFDLSVSFSMNDSEVKDLGPDRESLVESSTFGVEHRVGYPIGSWFHHRIVSAELDANGVRSRASMMCDNGSGGAVKCWNDALTQITAPRVFIGRSLPRFEGSVMPSLSFLERFKLNAMVDFKLDQYKWDHNERVRCALNLVCRENMFPLEYDPVVIAAYQEADRFGEQYINDASFAKLREVSLSYNVPSSFAARLGASRAAVMLAARNLHTWTKWNGMEPEAMFLGGARGGFVQLEQNNIPQLTQFVTTFNITF
jgi:TonB-linked SusC/RagA family outer membrane protein